MSSPPTFRIECSQRLKDAVMLGALASIGIEKGRPFTPEGDEAALLASAVAEGAQHMNDYFTGEALVK